MQDDDLSSTKKVEGASGAPGRITLDAMAT